MKGYYAWRGRCYTRTHYKTRTEGPPRFAAQFRSGYSTHATFQARGKGCTAVAASIRAPRRDNLRRGCGRTIEDGRENSATCAVSIDPIWLVTTVTRKLLTLQPGVAQSRGTEFGNPMCARSSCHCCVTRESCESSAALRSDSSALGRLLPWTKQSPRPAHAYQSCGYS
jgi:hypothetical protein